MIKQFESLADNFNKPVKDPLEQKETAAMVKKREKEKFKKEKSLGAKLRLKAKKNK